jgi:hypothetical protein
LSLLPRAHRHSSIVRSKHFQYYMFLDFRHGLLSDHEILDREFIVYDALYAQCRKRVAA